MIFSKIPETSLYWGAISVISHLNRAKFPAYLVGGCVRDLFLERDIADFDICTGAEPEEVMALFPKTIPTGLPWGTVTVVWDEHQYEVTTFRGEGHYSDGRRPNSVVFGVSLAEDLARRDFTINAMAYHPVEGLIDPFSGEKDLIEGILRTVGNPYQRFSEDYLRILRALRFTAILGFPIEEQTADAIHGTWEGLHQVTRERITQEIKKLVLGDFLDLLAPFYQVFEQGVFALDCLWEAEDFQQLEEKFSDISNAPKDMVMRLTLFLSLFHPDSGLLRLSKEESREIDFLSSETCLTWEGAPPFLQFVHTHGREQTQRMLFFQQYHYPYHKQDLQVLSQRLEGLTCTSLQELDLNGRDLIDHGVKSGEMVGKLLHIALDLVLEGVVENEKIALLAVIFGEEEENPSSS